MKLEGFESAIRFDVTGVDRNGRRFKLSYKEPQWALGINLWNGSVWAVLPDGKRKLVRRVWN